MQRTILRGVRHLSVPLAHDENPSRLLDFARNYKPKMWIFVDLIRYCGQMLYESVSEVFGCKTA